MNRYQLELQLSGVRDSLQSANEKLVAMYSDVTSKMEEREAQAQKVKDLEERELGLKAQLEKIDAEAAAKLAAEQKKAIKGENEKDKILNAKAELVRKVMAKEQVPAEVFNALGDGTTLNNGDKILPSTMTNELLYEPMATNPLRGTKDYFQLR